MRLGGALLFVFCFLGVTACAPMQSKFREVHVPPDRIVLKGYSLVPLSEEGWVIVGRDEYRLALAKTGAGADETIAIQAVPFGLPEFESTEEFVGLVKKGQAKDIDPQRFTIRQHEVVPYPKKGGNCAKSQLVTEDNAAIKRSKRSGRMILEAMVLTCAHPKDQKVGVSVTYSHRYYPEQGDAVFLEKAMSVIDSVEFADF